MNLFSIFHKKQMAISSKTRKILWGRSGNRCAICRRELVMDSTGIDSNSVIGEECHIVAREINGPRGSSLLPLEERDNVENLILLCRNHHKLIDDQQNTFTVESLYEIKSKHEKWVRESLSSSKQNPYPDIFFAYRVDTGTQIWNTVIECDGYSFDIVQSETEDEAHLLGGFAQNIREYGDLWNIIESRDRVLAQLEIDKQIKELSDNGFLVYATSRRHQLVLTNIKDQMDLLVGYVLVLRKDNPIVRKKDDEIEVLMPVKGQKQSEFSNYIPIMLDASSVRIV